MTKQILTQTKSTLEIKQFLLMQAAIKPTNHILHLILSIITMGLWIIPWLLIAHNNHYARVEAIDNLTKKEYQNEHKPNANTGYFYIAMFMILVTYAIYKIFS